MAFVSFFNHQQPIAKQPSKKPSKKPEQVDNKNKQSVLGINIKSNISETKDTFKYTTKQTYSNVPVKEVNKPEKKPSGHRIVACAGGGTN